MTTLIAAASENNALGYKGELLWHLPKDFKRFKSLTTGHCIIMGRKTFETLPKLLPDRTHIIITRQADYQAGGCIVVGSLAEALEKAHKIDENPYVIGGGEIYHLAMNVADKIELTRVHATFNDADAFFPSLSPQQWELVFSQRISADEKHAHDFTFETYARKKQ